MTASFVHVLLWSSLAAIFPGTALNASQQAETKASATRLRIELKPCYFAAFDGKVLCGTYAVFEDRTAQSGRRLVLRLVVLPALDPSAAPDPVFFLSGGPGQGAAKVASAGEDRLMSLLRRKRDLVFVDNRGTGESHPLHCNFSSSTAAPQNYFDELFPPNRVRSCRATLESGADLRHYTTFLAMADLDDIRAGLGYEKINLYGVSYGTLAALEYLRQFPDRVRSLALAGVAIPRAKLPLHFPDGAQGAMDALLRDCSADELCRAAFPELAQDLAQVLSALSEQPATFRVPYRNGRETHGVTMSRGVFTEHLRKMLYSASSASLVPLLIDRAAGGDWTSFGRVVLGTPASAPNALALGAYLSVTCSESVPFINDDEIAMGSDTTFVGRYRITVHRQACVEWPQARVPRTFFDPVRSSVPVLMLSGELDPATPPDFAAEAARTLPKSHRVILRKTAHAYSSSCVASLVGEFIATGSAVNLSTSCANHIERPPFIRELPARYLR
jgi:pimeloyl-ACP methyl ester carboxylesterase